MWRGKVAHDKKTKITAAEMQFPIRVVGKTTLNREQNKRVRERFDLGCLVKGIERAQLKFYGHVSITSEGTILKNVREG